MAALSAKALARRAELERSRHGSLDAALEIADSDFETGGGIIAGALAYRLFIWLLPLALVLVAGLGIAAESASRSPEQAAGSLGLAALVSGSVAGAAESPNRWYALLVGVPVLLIATRSVLRVLTGAHRLIWGEPRRAVPKPTVVATLRLLVLVLCIPLTAIGANWLRGRSGWIGLVATLAALAGYGALWLLISIRLPHRDARWVDLLPGTAVFAVGVWLVHLVGAYALQPYALNKQGTYGALGLAAALLVALFVIGRLMVAAAVVNATLWRRRARG